jgi:hypothetical protein
MLSLVVEEWYLIESLAYFVEWNGVTLATGESGLTQCVDTKVPSVP